MNNATVLSNHKKYKYSKYIIKSNFIPRKRGVIERIFPLPPPDRWRSFFLFRFFEKVERQKKKTERRRREEEKEEGDSHCYYGARERKDSRRERGRQVAIAFALF